jgi:hypothetical protein
MLRARPSLTFSATSCCWAPSCRSRSSLRRASSCAATSRCREARSSSTRSRRRSRSRALPSTSDAWPAICASSSRSCGVTGSSRRRSKLRAPSRSPSSRTGSTCVACGTSTWPWRRRWWRRAPTDRARVRRPPHAGRRRPGPRSWRVAHRCRRRAARPALELVVGRRAGRQVVDDRGEHLVGRRTAAVDRAVRPVLDTGAHRLEQHGDECGRPDRQGEVRRIADQRPDAHHRHGVQPGDERREGDEHDGPAEDEVDVVEPVAHDRDGGADRERTRRPRTSRSPASPAGSPPRPR